MNSSPDKKTDDKARLDEMAKDIEYLKAAVNKGNPLISYLIDASSRYSRGALVSGIMFLVVSFLFQFAVFYYEGEANLPDWIKLSGVAGLIAVLIATSIWKFSILAKEAKHFGSAVSFMEAIMSFFTGPFLHIHVTSGLTLLAGGGFLLSRGLGWYALPLLSAYFALICHLYANTGGNLRFRALGYWSLFTGIVILPIVDFAPYFCFGLMFGTILVSFSVINLVYGAPKDATNA